MVRTHYDNRRPFVDIADLHRAYVVWRDTHDKIFQAVLRIQQCDAPCQHCHPRVTVEWVEITREAYLALGQ